jgi:hypothetical protein
MPQMLGRWPYFIVPPSVNQHSSMQRYLAASTIIVAFDIFSAGIGRESA